MIYIHKQIFQIQVKRHCFSVCAMSFNFSHTSQAFNPPPQQLASQQVPWRYTATPAFQYTSSSVVSGAPNGLQSKMQTVERNTHTTYVLQHKDK